MKCREITPILAKKLTQAGFFWSYDGNDASKNIRRIGLAKRQVRPVTSRLNPAAPELRLDQFALKKWAVSKVRVSRSKFWVGLLLLAVVSGTGCSTTRTSRVLMPTPIGLAVGMPHPGGDFHDACGCADDEIPIFVVSNRTLDQKQDGPDPFGTQRSQKPSLGIAYVTIGEGLNAEELHQQTVTHHTRKKAHVQFKRMELTPQQIDVNPWLVKDEVVRHDGNPWVQAITDRLDRSSKRNVCVFVHGYNTTFIDNTLLAAEIHHYLGRQGAMISFEWPSESRLLGYIADKGNAAYSTRHFAH